MRIFLKSLGISKLLAKHEEPTYHEKKVVAHTNDELSVLYGAADPEETFLLDFFIGSMARDHEAHGCRYRDMTGTTLTLYGKQDKTRTVEISERLADAINARRKRLGAGPNDLLFPNGNGNPTSTSCVIFKQSPSEQGRSLRLSCTSCAKPERAGGILRTSRSPR